MYIRLDVLFIGFLTMLSIIAIGSALGYLVQKLIAKIASIKQLSNFLNSIVDKFVMLIELITIILIIAFLSYNLGLCVIKYV